MIQVIDKSKCCGCSVCAQVCPRNCINMIEDEEGFWYPRIDESNCIHCNICDTCCSFGERYTSEFEMKAFAAKSVDDVLRKNSSSGGAFSIIAQKIIEDDGIVFGAAFHNRFRELRHTMVDNVNMLGQLRGSKYLQSKIFDVYNCAKEYLKDGKKVLFSGTPCQVEGLKRFLKKDYENLITIEVVCHGVPSPLLWRKYVEWLEGQYHAKVVNVNFRSKNEGWKLFCLEEEFENGIVRSENLKKDIYMKLFLNNFCLRPSCYECKTRCVSDIILGDLWGIQEILPEWDDDKGTSMILVNSVKGNKLFESIKDKMEYREVDIEQAVKHNPSVYISVLKPVERDEFFEELQVLPFDELKKKYEKILKTKDNKLILKKIMYYIKHTLLLIIKKVDNYK